MTSSSSAAVARPRPWRALAWTRVVMAKLGLMLNEAKTSVKDARRESFDFLGYTFGSQRYRKDGHWYLGASPSKRSVQRGACSGSRRRSAISWGAATKRPGPKCATG